MDASQITDYYDKFKLKVITSERGVSQVKTDEKTGKQTGGNPMDTVDLEFIDNAPINIRNPDTGDIEQVDVNGLQVRTWVTLVPAALGPVNTFRKAIGLPSLTIQELMSSDGNTYNGKVALAMIRFKGREIKNSAGEKVINDHTGKIVTVGERKIDKWLTP